MVRQRNLGMEQNLKKTSNSYQEKLISLAFQFQIDGNISEAIKYYQIFLSEGFNDPRVFSNYGGLCQQIGLTQKAISLYYQSIKLYPNNAIAYCNLGIILKTPESLKKAELFTRKAITLKPDFIEAHTNLGLILLSQGKLEEAEVSFRKTIELKPDYANGNCNLGGLLIEQGKPKEAELFIRKAIELNPNDVNAVANLGLILLDQGKLEDAESYSRKAINLKPDYANAYANLAGVLKSLGKLDEARLSILKAIELEPEFARAYYILSTLKFYDKIVKWKESLFSENIFQNQTEKDKVDIYFARANLLHRDKRYKMSSHYLQLGNQLKLKINPSNAEYLIRTSRELLHETTEVNTKKSDCLDNTEHIFIVGMLRSGSTLLESIISMNPEVADLGEVNIFEDSLNVWREQIKKGNRLDLSGIYSGKIASLTNDAKKITTNKFLPNYQYTGIITTQIPNSRIIHCHRNPLDNILSIYRAHFAIGNLYSSSLVDCTNVYINQDEIMSEYYNRYPTSIYSLNYDLLVTNPNKEIKSLISWLGWDWDDKYLLPHLNPRAVSTASNVQVRYPININSVGGWINYKDMLQPAIDILADNCKYSYLNL